jgi:uncharacterized protein (DUF983 family)
MPTRESAGRAADGSVSVAQILARGLSLRCPNCGSRTLFAGWLRMRDRCAVCGLLFEPEEGFFLGSMVLNYTFTALVAGVIPCILLLAGLAYAPEREQIELFAGAVVAGITLPFLCYRPSKSLWLMIYYAALPGELPANAPSRPDTSNNPHTSDDA